MIADCIAFTVERIGSSAIKLCSGIKWKAISKEVGGLHDPVCLIKCKELLIQLFLSPMNHVRLVGKTQKNSHVT